MQRWWYNTQYWNGSGPVFVYIEGETAGSPYNVEGGQHAVFAQAYGALLLALEHRFYGSSIPAQFTDLSTPNLATLSSHQAIADLATFLTLCAGPRFGFDPATTRIVTFGGSYPGVLAAQARLRLPHLVHASLASSAPVQNAMDYWGYNAVVGASLASPDVNGSAACVAGVTAAFDQIAAAFNGSAAERHAMAARLHNCGGLDGANDTSFAVSEYSNILKGIVQGNDQWWQPYSIQQICGNVTGAADPLSGLVAFLSTWMQASNGGNCYSTSYAAEVAYVSNPALSQWSGSDQYRQWLWQLCSQFGQGQTCDAGTGCPFSSLYPDAASNAQTCVDVFGPSVFPSAAAVPRLVANTNALLGGRGIAATRVVYVNGAVDPWHAAGMWNMSADPVYQPSIFIPGASHCRDMIAPDASDPPALQAARKQIGDALAVFMSIPVGPIPG